MQCYLCLIDTWNPSEARDAKGFGKKKKNLSNLDSKTRLGI